MRSEDEEWRIVSRWPKYEVSNLGRIRSKRGLRTTQTDVHGYPFVMLWHNTKYRNERVHVLVCEAFHGPIPFESAMALHGPDHNKSNCRSDNLRWGTHADNTRDWMESRRCA